MLRNPLFIKLPNEVNPQPAVCSSGSHVDLFYGIHILGIFLVLDIQISNTDEFHFFYIKWERDGDQFASHSTGHLLFLFLLVPNFFKLVQQLVFKWQTSWILRSYRVACLSLYLSGICFFLTVNTLLYSTEREKKRRFNKKC